MESGYFLLHVTGESRKRKLHITLLMLLITFLCEKNVLLFCFCFYKLLLYILLFFFFIFGKSQCTIFEFYCNALLMLMSPVEAKVVFILFMHKFYF